VKDGYYYTNKTSGIYSLHNWNTVTVCKHFNLQEPSMSIPDTGSLV